MADQVSEPVDVIQDASSTFIGEISGGNVRVKLNNGLEYRGEWFLQL
jgi:small nuclear ribonucleoprotein (snRNP)-like protein